MLCAKLCEPSQAFLFFFSKTESEIFAVIAKQELLIEFWVAGVSASGYNFRDHFVKVSKVFIGQRSQTVRDLFCIGDFRPNQPECVNEWKPGESLPLLAKIPELKLIRMILPKANRLI